MFLKKLVFPVPGGPQKFTSPLVGRSMASDDDTSITKQILNLILETNELRILIGTLTGVLLLILVLVIYVALKVS